MIPALSKSTLTAYGYEREVTDHQKSPAKVPPVEARAAFQVDLRRFHSCHCPP